MRQNTASKCFHKQTLATRSLNLRSKDGKKKPTKKGMMPLSSAPTEMLLNSVITESNQFAIIADLGPSNCTAYAESTPLPPFPLSLPLPTHSLLWLGYTPSKTHDVRIIVQTSRRPKPGKKKTREQTTVTNNSRIAKFFLTSHRQSFRPSAHRPRPRPLLRIPEAGKKSSAETTTHDSVGKNVFQLCDLYPVRPPLPLRSISTRPPTPLATPPPNPTPWHTADTCQACVA